jgi:hypothetical protein
MLWGVATGGVLSLISGGIAILFSHDNAFDVNGNTLIMKRESLLKVLNKKGIRL